jgi:hypothetical protein
MQSQSLAEKIASYRVSLGLVLGIAILVILIALTWVLQYSLKWIDLTQNLTDLWIWILYVGFGVGFTLINLGILKSRHKKPVEHALPEKVVAQLPEKQVGVISAAEILQSAFAQSDGLEPEVTALLKLGYECLIKQNLLEMKPQFRNYDINPIYFKYWNDTKDKLKKELIDNKEIYDILENISRAVNDRNNDLNKASRLMVGVPTSVHVYAQAFDKYYEKLRQLGFI